MAYNRNNLLKKIDEIQKITLQKKEEGASQIWIYRHHIARQYHISYSAFNNYLGVNVESELKKEKAKKTLEDRQLRLFD
jgi:hypothetical protein